VEGEQAETLLFSGLDFCYIYTNFNTKEFCHIQVNLLPLQLPLLLVAYSSLPVVT
jgi:hypothetical protein